MNGEHETETAALINPPQSLERQNLNIEGIWPEHTAATNPTSPSTAPSSPWTTISSPSVASTAFATPPDSPNTLLDDATLEIISLCGRLSVCAPPLDRIVKQHVTHTDAECLQCQVLQLPCDRRLPSCSRCERRAQTQRDSMGLVTLCLAQGLKTAHEITSGEQTGASKELAKGWWDELEGDKGWQTKQELKEKLEKEETDKLDKQNWVLPVSPRPTGWRW